MARVDCDLRSGKKSEYSFANPLELIHAASLCRARGHLGHRLSSLHPRPVVRAAGGTVASARDFWTEFSVAIGYAGLAMMGLQFGLTARFRYVTEPWGEDVIYHFHRQISLIAVALVIAHPLILFVVRPELLALLNSIRRRGAPASPPVDLLVDRAGGDGAVAREVEDPLRDVAPTHIVLAVVAVAAGVAAHGGLGLLSGRPLEAVAVDRPDDLLDRAAAVRSHRQAALHAPPAVPRVEVRKERGDTCDVGDAA